MTADLPFGFATRSIGYRHLQGETEPVGAYGAMMGPGHAPPVARTGHVPCPYCDAPMEVMSCTGLGTIGRIVRVPDTGAPVGQLVEAEAEVLPTCWRVARCGACKQTFTLPPHGDVVAMLGPAETGHEMPPAEGTNT